MTIAERSADRATAPWPNAPPTDVGRAWPTAGVDRHSCWGGAGWAGELRDAPNVSLCRNCVPQVAADGSGALSRDDLDRQVELALDSMGKVGLQPSGDGVRKCRQDDLVERVASNQLSDP